MLSIDTNILLHYCNSDSPLHSQALEFMEECFARDDVALCELVLVELYILLRNPAVVKKPLSAPKATELCQNWRQHPRWQVVDYDPEIASQLWERVAQPRLGFRQIIDIRLGLTLVWNGIEEFATANTRDFQTFGFERVWNPLL